MDPKGKRAWVTGSSGFIGTHLKAALETKDIDLVDVGRVNITDRDAVLEVPTSDMVFHLAGKMFVPFAWENPGIVHDINVGGTLNVLEYCRVKGVKRIVLASSYVYGIPKYLPIDEGHPIATNNPYSRSKRLAEELVRGYCEDYGIRGTILRMFNIYGPGQRGDLLIPTILRQLAGPEILLENPTPKRDYLYISDAVNAFLRAEQTITAPYDIFNIGSGESHSVDEIAKMLLRLSGSKATIKYRQIERKGEIPDVVANVKKANRLLNWRPTVKLDEGLRLTLQSHPSTE